MPSHDYVSDEIIVKFKPGVTAAARDRIISSQRATVRRMSPFAGFKQVRIPAGKTVAEMVQRFRDNPNVEYAEPHYVAHLVLTPNDPWYVTQWNLHNPVYGGIHMEDAWDITTGDSNTVIAVLDTGVAYENYSGFALAPDLAGTRFVTGYNAFTGSSHANDDNGHGTHVCGVLAQTTDNSHGSAGIAFSCSIMPVKVADQNASVPHAQMADGVYFATDNGAHIINMSFSGAAPSITMENAVAYAYSNGVPSFCAAGNGGPLAGPGYPAAYDAYCVAVSATRYDEAIAPYSNIGNYIDLAAPGGDRSVNQNGDIYVDGIIHETFFMNPTSFNFYNWEGTSLAAPHAAGVAALLVSLGISGPDTIRNILQTTAEDKGAAGWDPSYGWGIVNAHQALLTAGMTTTTTTTTTTSTTSSTTVATVVQDFEDWPQTVAWGSTSHDGWTFSDGQVKQNRGGFGPPIEVQCGWLHDFEDSPNSWIQSPLFTCGVVSVSFWTRRDVYSGGSSFAVVQTSSNAQEWIDGDVFTVAAGEWTQRTFAVGTAIPTYLRIRKKGDTAAATYAGIDDIIVVINVLNATTTIASSTTTTTLTTSTTTTSTTLAPPMIVHMDKDMMWAVYTPTGTIMPVYSTNLGTMPIEWMPVSVISNSLVGGTNVIEFDLPDTNTAAVYFQLRQGP